MGVFFGETNNRLQKDKIYTKNLILFQKHFVTFRST